MERLFDSYLYRCIIGEEADGESMFIWDLREGFINISRESDNTIYKQVEIGEENDGTIQYYYAILRIISI